MTDSRKTNSVIVHKIYEIDNPEREKRKFVLIFAVSFANFVAT